MTPGEADFATSELERSERSLAEAEALLEMGSLEGAASRLYYAAFHAVRAALSVRGEHARTHSGQITLFTAAYGPAPLLGRLLELRADADYGEEPFSVPRPRLQELVAETEELISRCRGLVTERLESGPDEPDAPPDD